MSREYRNFEKGISLTPNATTQNSIKGDLETLQSDNKLHFFGASNDAVVTETVAAIITNKSIDGNTNTLTNIGNSSLTNNSLTVNTVTIPLGGSGTITANTNNTLTIGTGLSGGSFNGSSPVTIAIDSSIVTLNGVQTLTDKSIDGSVNTLTNIPNSSLVNNSITVNGTTISLGASGTVTADASTLTGTTLNSTVVNSSLTSVSTITSGTWNGTTIDIAHGGTSATTKAAAFDALSPMTTGGDLIYGGVSGTGTRLPNGTSGQVLQSNGATSAPSWVNSTITPTAPTLQSFLINSGAIFGYYFVVTSANATIGATYTNNSSTFVVQSTISGSTTLFTQMTAGSGPLTSGTLTKTSGTGDATITFSRRQELHTYTRPTGPTPLYLKVKMVGGGGEGGALSNITGNSGTSTIFGTNLFIANGGAGGTTGTSSSGHGNGGAGGTVSTTGGLIIAALTGGSGSGTTQPAASVAQPNGGTGASSPFGGAGGGGQGNGSVNGSNGVANTGSGGGGQGNSTVSDTCGGGGGGAGGYIEAILASPSTTYLYSIGSGGSGAGSGGDGGSGVVIVEEYYQ